MRWPRIVLVSLLASAGLVYGAAYSDEPQRDPDRSKHQMEELSYGVGFYLGQEIEEGLKLDGVQADLDFLIRGFTDGVKRQPAMYPPEEMDAILFAVHEEMQARMVRRLLAEDPAFKRLHDENLARCDAYHEAHKHEPGVITLDNGIQYKVLRHGRGGSPTLEDTVIVNYRITLVDGTEIDRGEAAEIAIKSMRQGGQHVLQMMTVGAKWHVAVPPNLAYGPGGDPPRIGPNETLVAEIELLGIKE